jgi:hypothetical protein
MPLQRLTIGACHVVLWFPLTSGPTCSANVSPNLGPLLHHVDLGHVLRLSPRNRARLITYSILN